MIRKDLMIVFHIPRPHVPVDRIRRIYYRDPHERTMGYRFALLAASLWLALHAFAQTPDRYSYLKNANRAYQDQRYKDCYLFLEKAFVMKDPSAQEHFNIACCYAMDGESVQAMNHLDKAVDKGYLDINYLRANKNLVSLHTDAAWLALIRKLEQKVAAHEQSLNKPLRQRLLSLKAADVAFKNMLDSLYKVLPIKIIDSFYSDQILAHYKKLHREMKAITDEFQWPGKDQVGEDGAVAAFYIVRRLNPKAQKRYLAMLAAAGRAGKTRLSYAAMLHDEVLRAEGKKQKYGTLVEMDDSGKYRLYPLEDEAKVNERRSSVGLIPLEEYLIKFDIRYLPKQ